MIDDAKNGNTNKISPGRTNSRSSKAEALKDSQEEQESFINKSMVDDS